MSDSNYRHLLKEHIAHIEPDGEGTRKKRKLKSFSPEPVIEIDTDSPPSNVPESGSDSDSDDFEDIDLEEKPHTTATHTENSDEEDFEDVQDYSFLRNADNQVAATDESITIALQEQQQPQKPTKRKVEFISKEQREFRVAYHQMCIVLMICHGFVRNKWCNDYNFLVKLRRSVSVDILDELTSIRQRGNNRASMVNAVRFTDIVRSVMFGYASKFRVTKEGIVRKNWNELSISQPNIQRDMSFLKFKNSVYSFQGSRDVGAQGFLAVCRSLGMKARLVFSLQPPDFSMVAALPKIELQTKESKPELPKNARNAKQRFLQSKRAPSPQPVSYKFPTSSFPIFWVEVWNKYNKKWLCVDPIVLKVVEQPPMRRKSSFEPPMSDPSNNLVYVIAYDANGGVKDVTRRYAQQYNSRVVKKRITSKSEAYDDWYKRVISSISTQTKLSNIDIKELKEFRDRDLAEGMPNNAAGFKDHPIYAIESQLRQNEIIHPMDQTTRCGTFRYKTSKSKSAKADLVPVYKRSAVHILRSPRAWYMMGRVLKVGAQPLKIKKAKKWPGAGNKRAASYDDDDDDEEEEETRLYAEFQTKMYIPPPVEDGKIVKNAYGNIDVYVPTMIPEGGYLYEATDTTSVKILEQAAKILEIDYAKAVVAFDFGKSKGRKSFRRSPTAREGGVVVATEFKEAMELMVKQLVDDERQQKVKLIELNALRNWKFILTKLRVTKRLEKSHGKVEKDNKFHQDDDQSSDFSVYSEDEDSADEFEAGGFVPGEFEPEKGEGFDAGGFDAGGFEPGGFGHTDTANDGGFLPESGVSDEYAGGFVTEPSAEGGFPIEGGFEDDGSEGGGFLPEEDPVRVSSTDDVRSHSGEEEIVEFSADDMEHDDKMEPDADGATHTIDQEPDTSTVNEESAPVEKDQKASEEDNESDLELLTLPGEFFTTDNGKMEFNPDNGDTNDNSAADESPQTVSSAASIVEVPSEDSEGFDFEYSEEE